MLERQDIDALLISALYGELTPADEARLNAHLDSHPGDKSALADLTSARTAIRESRFLTVQIEPPQAVSALLLQEASRSAPVRAVAAEPPKESWFHRFISSFARHPATTAAAMLVVVVGVAGTMYLRNGGKGQFAEQSTETFARDQAPASAPAALEEGQAGKAGLDEARVLQNRAGSAFSATLAEPEAAADKPADAKATAKLEKARDDRQDSKEAKKPAPTRTYIGVQSERPPEPKELEQDFGGASSLDGDVARRAKGGQATGNTRTPPPAVVIDRRNEKRDVIATPPPPPPRAPQAAPRGGAPGAGAGDDLSKDKSVENDESTWAREQHTKVANAVKANNCKDATALAVALSNRAPAYFAQNVENDRALKQCMTYITAEREKVEAQKQQQRALQKRNADEADRARRAAPPTTNSK